MQRETHCCKGYFRIAAKQISKTAIPLTCGGNLIEKVFEDSEYGKYPVVGHRKRIMPMRIFLPLRYVRFESQFAVPKATMMSADVSNHVQRAKPGLKNSVLYPILAGNHAADIVMNAIKKGQHFPEAHDLAQHPEGRQVMAIAVLCPEMLNKCFPAAFYFILHLFDPSFITVRFQFGERGLIHITECALPTGKMVDKLGPDGNFYTFNGVHDQYPQLPVEGIVTPNQIEACISPEEIA